MTGIDRSGLRVEVPTISRDRALCGMRDRPDEEIRGLFAQTLRLANIPPRRAAKILRTSLRTYFRDLATTATAPGD